MLQSIGAAGFSASGTAVLAGTGAIIGGLSAKLTGSSDDKVDKPNGDGSEGGPNNKSNSETGSPPEECKEENKPQKISEKQNSSWNDKVAQMDGIDESSLNAKLDNEENSPRTKLNDYEKSATIKED